MGNRAVITFKGAKGNDLGVYLHWNGGVDSVLGFLQAAKELRIRGGGDKAYFFARFCQIIGNFFGGTNSVGIGRLKELDCDNGDNGVYYLADDLTIVARECIPEHKQGERFMQAKSFGELQKAERDYMQGVYDQCMRINGPIFKGELVQRQWFVVCLDDDRRMTFATRKAFDSHEQAAEYAKTVAASRTPLVAYAADNNDQPALSGENAAPALGNGKGRGNGKSHPNGRGA